MLCVRAAILHNHKCSQGNKVPKATAFRFNELILGILLSEFNDDPPHNSTKDKQRTADLTGRQRCTSEYPKSSRGIKMHRATAHRLCEWILGNYLSRINDKPHTTL